MWLPERVRSGFIASLCVRKALREVFCIARGNANPLGDARLAIEDADLKLLSSTMLIAQLVGRGVSRLTAERFVELERGDDQPGRARPHSAGRR